MGVQKHIIFQYFPQGLQGKNPKNLNSQILVGKQQKMVINGI